MTFTLTIELGNDAMQTTDDIATALEAVAVQLQRSGAINPEYQQKVRDRNGNTVGRWEVTE